jgi:hypothetical protein
MEIFFATWLEDNQGITLTKAEAQKRLMSFFFLKDLTEEQIRGYVERGLIPAKEGGNK